MKYLFYSQLQANRFLAADYGAIENIGAYISVNRPRVNTAALIAVTPQIKNPAGRLLMGNYTQITGLYTATGGEEYYIRQLR